MKKSNVDNYDKIIYGNFSLAWLKIEIDGLFLLDRLFKEKLGFLLFLHLGRIIRRFSGDAHVMWMGFFHTGCGNFDEFSIAL